MMNMEMRVWQQFLCSAFSSFSVNLKRRVLTCLPHRQQRGVLTALIVDLQFESHAFFFAGKTASRRASPMSTMVG